MIQREKTRACVPTGVCDTNTWLRREGESLLPARPGGPGWLLVPCRQAHEAAGTAPWAWYQSHQPEERSA